MSGTKRNNRDFVKWVKKMTMSEEDVVGFSFKIFIKIVIEFNYYFFDYLMFPGVK